MKHVVYASIVTIFLAGTAAQVQQPEPGLWWANSPGAPIDEEVRISATPNGLVITAVRFGKTPVSWGPIASATDGTIEFSYAGDRLQPCTLKRTEHDTYVGSCRGSATRPLTLAKWGNPGGFEVAVSEKEFDILARARQRLSNESVWNRHDDRACENSQAKQSWSLSCALDQASIDVVGVDLPGRPVMQEARAAIVEVAHRGFQAALRDFNNLESTAYSDIVKVFDGTARRLRTMKACLEPPDAKMFARSQNAERTDALSVVYWSERIGHTVDGQTYVLINLLGPMDQSEDPPENLVTASASVTRRALPHDARHAVDIKGALPNGLQWRYANLCGESLIYRDVAPEAATYFDRVIDAAYFQSLH